MLLMRLLGKANVELREAENGLEAFVAWIGWRPDLIFMDLMMPVMDGYEAMRKIRQTSRGHMTIIITYTASSNKTSEFIVPADSDDILFKPFKLPELATLMKQHLNLDL